MGSDQERSRLEDDVTSAIDRALNDLLPWTGQPEAHIRGQIENAKVEAKRRVVELIRRHWPKDRD